MAAGMPQEWPPWDIMADRTRRLGKAGGQDDLPLSAWAAGWMVVVLSRLEDLAEQP